MSTMTKSPSLFSSTPNPQRLFDHLQNVYNSSAVTHKAQQKHHKNLYFALIQKDHKRKQQKKSLEKEINKYENQQIDSFWKNRENQLKQRERKRRELVQETRNANNNAYAQKVLSRSMVMESDKYSLARNQYYDNLNEYQTRINQEKCQKSKFLQQAQSYKDYKKVKQQIQRQKNLQDQRKKLYEKQQIQYKRKQQLEIWRRKYMEPHNKVAFQIWDNERKNRISEQDALQNYIVNQGAKQLSQRTYRMKNDILNRQRTQKQQYISQLHSQLQHNEFRNANDKKSQQQNEKKIISQRSHILEQNHRLTQQQQTQKYRQHLEYLKSQIKPRSLLPEKEKIQYAGIGSPVHIGKVVADDRKKQLEWLERSLYKELAY